MLFLFTETASISCNKVEMIFFSQKTFTAKEKEKSCALQSLIKPKIITLEEIWI